MKRIVLGLLFAFCLSLPACQCSDKPDIGPVEGEDASYVTKTPRLV